MHAACQHVIIAITATLPTMSHTWLDLWAPLVSMHDFPTLLCVVFLILHVTAKFLLNLPTL